jgi:hypothetical protein
LTAVHAALQLTMSAPDDVEDEGKTALMLAAQSKGPGGVSVVLALLATGVAGCGLNRRDAKGRTALMLAATCGFAAVIQALIEAGADLDIICHRSESAWTKARRGGHQHASTLLEAAGARLGEARDTIVVFDLVDLEAAALAAEFGHSLGRAYGKWDQHAPDAVAAAARLMAHGVLGIRSALGAVELDALRAHVDLMLALHHGQVTGAGGREKQLSVAFGPVRERWQRYDLKLDIEPAVRDALAGVSTRVGSILDMVLSPEAVVVELACLVSDPGARAQPYHPDTLASADLLLFTCFVALQNIDEDMGPTWVLPGTHTEEAHARLNDPSVRGERDRELAGLRSVHMSCRAGDVFVMDSRLWHRGGANASASRRRLFYVTFGLPRPPTGLTHSILDDLQGKLRLHDYRRG